MVEIIITHLEPIVAVLITALGAFIKRKIDLAKIKQQQKDKSKKR